MRRAGGTSPAATVANARYVGGAACVACHAEEVRRLGAVAACRRDEARRRFDRLGNFNNTSFNDGRVTTRFSRRDGKFIVNTEGPDGKQHDYEVKYTFGLYPLQQYLIDIDNGRIQSLTDRLGQPPEGSRAASAGSRSIRERRSSPVSPSIGRGGTRTGTSCAPSAIRPT